METSPLICGANQWTGFYMITASVLKGLNKHRLLIMFYFIVRFINPSVHDPLISIPAIDR